MSSIYSGYRTLRLGIVLGYKCGNGGRDFKLNGQIA